MSFCDTTAVIGNITGQDTLWTDRREGWNRYVDFFTKPVLNDLKHYFSGFDACQGDSGGPLVIRESADDPWYQIGLVSFGLESICGGRKNGEKKPGIYTKVIHYLPWIESKLKE